MRNVWFLFSLACGQGVPTGESPDDDIIDSESDPEDGLACVDIQGEGYGLGQVSMDWTLQDIEGREVSLHDYCGRVVYIEDTTAW